MRYKVLFVISLLITVDTQAQIRAITENGDEVVLNPDKTWEYVDAEVMEAVALPVIETPFEKSDKSNFLLKSKIMDVGVYLNPKDWMFAKSESNPDAEYEFQLKGEDAYGLMITERMTIPVENLKEIAFDNIKSVSSDARIVEQDMRTVNGTEIIHLVIAAKVQGLDIYYYGYYFSSEQGSMQFLCYTGTSLVNRYEEQIYLLLNGFVELTKD